MIKFSSFIRCRNRLEIMHPVVYLVAFSFIHDPARNGGPRHNGISDRFSLTAQKTSNYQESIGLGSNHRLNLLRSLLTGRRYFPRSTIPNQFRIRAFFFSSCINPPRDFGAEFKMLAALSARLNRCILINDVLLLTVFLGKNEKKRLFTYRPPVSLRLRFLGNAMSRFIASRYLRTR